MVLKFELEINKAGIILLFLGLVIILATAGTIAYNIFLGPDKMGHQYNELTGVQKKINMSMCPGQLISEIHEDGSVSCATSGVSLPASCANNQVAKYKTASSTWQCEDDEDTDTNTDTRCDVAGNCNQIRIGGTTYGSW